MFYNVDSNVEFYQIFIIYIRRSIKYVFMDKEGLSHKKQSVITTKFFSNQ